MTPPDRPPRDRRLEETQASELASRVIAASLLVTLLCGFFTALLVTTPARSHGAAHWIQENPLYVDIDGVHCCGPADCDTAPAALFRETPQGIEIAPAEPGGATILFPRSRAARGLYTSIDDRWWLCRRGGVVRCVFKPSTGM